jgi:hypothetical protein
MYSTVIAMSKSPGLRDRLIGAAAQEGRADAQTWVDQNIWRLVSEQAWVEVWEYAAANMNPNVNQDIGARTDTIQDSTILSKVQAIITEDTPAPAE